MDQRVQFVSDWLSGEYYKVDLCRAYGISRPTGDKWLNRYAAAGVDGLKELSRTPQTHPNAISATICGEIIAMKLAHQDWGPKKVVDRLRELHPRRCWPADSTVGAILKRAGLVQPRRRRLRVVPDTQPFRACDQPNHTWSADFKGTFRLGNGQPCYPLTISDNCTRYLLQCRGVTRTSYDAVRPWFEWVFREYGLPLAIRTDNGPPFASLGLGGLTRLSRWWIRLGIKPERIRPGKPQENGRHERMHRTLTKGGVHPIQHTMPVQQQQFDAFLQVFNWERSHEALDRQPPGRLYGTSPRPYPAKLPEVAYDTGIIVRQVRHNGDIKWRGRRLFISEALMGEPVGLQQIDDQQWQIRYSKLILGVLDEASYTITPAQGWHGESD